MSKPTVEIEAATTEEIHPRANYLAAHPDLARVDAENIHEIIERFTAFRDRIAPVVVEFFDTNKDEVWEVAVLVRNWIDTLPGKHLTPDFYRYYSVKFIDRHGQSLSHSLLEWLESLARKYPDGVPPARALLTLWEQLPLKIMPPEDFKLATETVVRNPVPKKSAWEKVTDWMESPDVEANWSAVKSDPKYWQNGHLLPEFAAMMAAELEPKFIVLDEIRAELRLSNGMRLPIRGQTFESAVVSSKTAASVIGNGSSSWPTALVKSGRLKSPMEEQFEAVMHQ